MGVFYKDSTMSSWIWYNEGMPINTRVRDIEIYYDPSDRSKSHIVAATYGRGNWRSPLYDEDQKPPVADFNVDMKKVCANESVKFDDVSLNNPTRWKWVITPANAAYLNGTDSCSQNIQVKFNAPGKYAIKLVVDNCGGIDSLERLSYIEVFSAITPAVCINTSTGIGNYNIGILEVAIDTFINKSLDAFAEGEYMNRACTDIFYAKSDTTYAFDITTGKSYKENVKIYIDYNNNGDLSDAGELAYSGPKQLVVHQDSLRIPKIVVFDKLLRMRIMADYDTIPDDPCATLKYGQTEDFGIVISPRLPTPNFVAEFDSICLGETIKFSDSSEGSIYNYHWVIHQGAWSDSSSTPGDQIFTLPKSGFYSLTLYLNDKMVFKKQDSAVFVQAVPNLGIALSSGNLTGCEGRNIELVTMDSNALITKFGWQNDNNTLSETSATLILNNLVVGDSGNYQVVGEYFGCADTSEILTVQVFHKPTAAFDVNKDIQCFKDNEFVMTNNSTLGAGSITNLWTFDLGNTSALNDPSYTYGDTGAFDIKLRVASINGCMDSLVKSVQVLESPLASFSINLDSQCLKGNQFALTNNSFISSGSNAYNWRLGDGNNSTKTSPTHQYLVEGLFKIDLETTSPRGCKDTASKQVRVHPRINSILDWTNNGFNSCAKSNLQDIRSNSTISSGSIVYHEIRTGDGNVFYSNLVSNYTYQKEGLFKLELIEESDKGCRDTISSVQVSINPVPKMSFSLNDTLQCLNQNLFNVTDLSSIVSGSINNYTWDFGDGTNASSNTPTGHSYLNIGTYSLREIGTSDQGCKDTSEILVQVLPSPEVDFEGDEVCLGENTSFKNNTTISNGSITNYIWRFGDGQGSTSTEPLHRYNKIGTFNVELIANSNLNCLDTLTKSAALVHPIPNAQFDFMKVRSWEKETDIQFNDASSTDVSEWLWTYGGLGSSTEQNPLVTFSDTGKALIRLFVKNAIGCSDTSSQLIFIFPETEFYIPTSFSPNNDELNDQFKVSGLAFVKDYHLLVISRWGEVLFESNDINSTWDGTYKSVDVPSGSYLWIMELTDLNNTKIREKGSVLLLR
jgi:gliding motility-associated-like protein